MRTLEINNRELSPSKPCYIIAEIGVNHNGNLDLAHKMIDSAAQCKADAVKFQMFVPENLVLPDAKQANYQRLNDSKRNQLEMLQNLTLRNEDYFELKQHCGEVGLGFGTTAFDSKSLEVVLDMDPDYIKWPSGEIDNILLYRNLKSTSKPFILSTGMSNIGEIENAIINLNKVGISNIILLQCISQYPAPISEQNLLLIPKLSSMFNLPVGFSDHTVSNICAIGARTLGMVLLEKHFTLDKKMSGPDHQASIEPEQFRDLVISIRTIEEAMGSGIKKLENSEINTKEVARKSIVYIKDLPKGHKLQYKDLTSKRPASGLSPSYIDLIIGRELSRSVLENQILDISDLGKKLV